MSNLNASGTVTLNASGTGRVTLGPASAPGSAVWHVTGVIVATNRPGQAPVPRIQVYLDRDDPSGLQGLDYDGSFNQGACNLDVSRGQNLIAVWTGGQAGDIATLTVTGTQE